MNDERWMSIVFVRPYTSTVFAIMAWRLLVLNEFLLDCVCNDGLTAFAVKKNSSLIVVVIDP